MPDPEAKEVPLLFTRSTPVRPTIWMTGVLVWATVIAFLFHVPLWGGIFLCSLTGLSFLLYMVSYIYLLATDQEALRLEKYSVKKLPRGQMVLLKAMDQDRANASQPQVGFATQPFRDEAAILSTESSGKAVRRQEADRDES